jgi:transmembrane sensor
MSKASPDEDKLFDEAVDLMIRLQNDPENNVAIETIRRWCQRGPDYERAWSEASEIGGMAGAVMTGQRRDEPSLSRRKFVIGAPIVIGALAGGSYMAGGVFGPRPDFTSATAELRNLTLADGSLATLGPDSAIALDITGQRRELSLLSGMAYLDVAEVESRPFVVRASGLAAFSRNGAFDVSEDADFVTISVDHGSVTARGSSPAFGPEVQLEAGQWMRFDGRNSIDRGTREAGQIAAWRDGLIVAEKEPISAVIARIARWREGQVVVVSTWLGAQRISGVFDLQDPVVALEAVVQPYGGKVREVSSMLAIVSLI